MFTDDERFVILQALWNLKKATAQFNSSDDVPPEGALAVMGSFDVINSAVQKLGGDPNRPFFGLGLDR